MSTALDGIVVQVSGREIDLGQLANSMVQADRSTFSNRLCALRVLEAMVAAAGQPGYELARLSQISVDNL